MRDRVRAVWRAGVFLLHGAFTGFLSLLVLPVLLVLVLVARPTALQLVHAWTSQERRRVAKFTGERFPEVAPPEQLRAARRDITWFVTHALTGAVVGLLGAALPVAAVNAALVPLYWWLLPEDDPVASPYPVTSWTGAAFMPLLAAGYTAASLWVTPWLARVQSRWARSMLSPPPGARLAMRVAELTASRAAALEAHGAELRRIERDLHDGTQNRIVAVAMHLGIVERALRRDPAAALPLVLKAQDAASDALAGLRNVVRSIYPPVLAERGLDGAVAGLIARCAVPTTLTTTNLGRPPAAVESAAYFVVAEALTNVAKHSGANRCEVRLRGWTRWSSRYGTTVRAAPTRAPAPVWSASSAGWRRSTAPPRSPAQPAGRPPCGWSYRADRDRQPNPVNAAAIQIITAQPIPANATATQITTTNPTPRTQPPRESQPPTQPRQRSHHANHNHQPNPANAAIMRITTTNPTNAAAVRITNHQTNQPTQPPRGP